MSDTTFRIAIDSSGAEAGARRVQQSLEAIRQEAARTANAIDAMRGNLKTGSDIEAGSRGIQRNLRGIQQEAARTVTETRNMEAGFNRLGSSGGGASDIRRNLQDVNNEARRVVSSTDDMRGGFSRLVNTATSLQGVLAGMGAAATFQEWFRTVSDFETSMSRIRTATRATGEELQSLEDMARTLGSTQKFGAKETADGMAELAFAGMETNEVLAAMPAVINMATASEIDLAQASKIATNTLSIFRLEASDMGRVSDVLAKAAAISSTNIRGIGMALSYVGPVAAAFGAEVEDLSAAIALLSNNGLDAERAGTGLRGVLAVLNDPTKEVRKEVSNLGLSLRDIAPSSNTLLQIMQKLRGAGITASQAFAMFGNEAAPAVINLLNNTDELERFGQVVRDNADEAAKMAAIMNDNIGSDFNTMIAVTRELAMQLGDSGLSGSLRSLIQGATGVMRVWAGQDKVLGDSLQHYQEMAKVVEQLAVIIGTTLVAKALGPMIAKQGQATAAKVSFVAASLAAQRATALEASTAAAAAASTLAIAQANVAGAQAQLRMAVATSQATGSMVAQNLAATNLRTAHIALGIAQARATATSAAMNTALAATTLRARAATVAMAGLNTAMAFFGGPVGAAITAIAGGIYLLHQRTDEAAESQKIHNDRMDRMVQINSELAGATAERRAELEAERQQLVKNTEAELDRANAQLMALEARKAAGQATIVDKVENAPRALDQALGFKGAGINDAVEAIGSLPGMGALGSMLNLSTGDMKLETTDKQIADTSGQVKTLTDRLAALKTKIAEPTKPITVKPTRQELIPKGSPSEKGSEDELSDSERMLEALRFEEEQLNRTALMREVYNNLRRADIDTSKIQASTFEELLPQLSAEGEQIASLTRVLFDAELAEKAREEAIKRGLETSRERERQEERQRELVQNTITGLQEEERYYRQLSGTIGMSNREFEVEAGLMEIRNRLLAEGATLTAQQEAAIRRLLGAVWDHKNGVEGARQALAEYARSLELTAEVMAQGAIRGFGHLEDALVDIVTGSKSAKEAVADMAKAIAADFARMAIRAAIMRPMMMAFGFATGGVMTSSGPAIGGDPYAFAKGGIMTSMGPLPLNTYAGGGVANTPQVAIFGEGRKPEAFVPLPDGRNIPVKLQGGGEGRPSGPGGNTFVANVNVTPPQGSSQQDAERFGEVISRQMESAFTDMLQRQQRPGGLLNPNGGY